MKANPLSTVDTPPLGSDADVESFMIEYYGAWQGIDEDRIMSYYAENVTVQIPGTLMQGQSAVREQFVRPFITGFPGNRHIVKSMTFGQNVVVVEFSFNAQHKGPFAGRAATDAQVEVLGTGVYEYDAATRQITAARIYFDVGTLLKQLLDPRYPPLTTEEAAAAPTGPIAIAAPVEHLDLATVIAVSQTVSGETVLERLLDTLMRTAVAHAGAERALLILSRAAEQRVAAEATSNNDTVVVHLCDDPVTGSVLPESVLRYVLRTRESVILDDAAILNPFSTDPYIAQQQKRSVFCLPLTNQAKLIGALYLENLAPRVFAPARTGVLKLLASQAAISLENTRLYRDLKASEREARMIVDSIPGFVASLSPAGELEFVNNGLIEYCGQELEAMKQWGTNGTVHADDLPHVVELFSRGITSGEPYGFDARIRRYDGIYRWFQIRGLPLRDMDGQIVRWYSLLSDVDDRKRAEAELSALKDQLYKENLVLRDEVDRTSMFEEIVGTSPALQPLLARVAKVAKTESTVLITGETGTGKELVARAVHKRSQRSRRAFVSVNCAALAPTLIPSELFGHEKGAFTGATQRRLGRFELADGGTIFLDEVGELLPDTQVALLRVLQEREFERVGGTQAIHVDVRVIAATNRDLTAAIAKGSFRQDLFYRLNVFPIEVPPLRERKDDLLMLIEYFVQRYASQAGKTIRSIDKETLDLLKAYDWPGNVRELQNVIERSMILSSGGVFTVDELWLSTQSSQPAPRMTAPAPLQGDQRDEREMIEAALAESRGRIAGPSGAAARLNIPPSTLEYKIRSLKIRKSQFKFGGGSRETR
jgi:PAS domain S-box-containing protein